MPAVLRTRGADVPIRVPSGCASRGLVSAAPVRQTARSGSTRHEEADVKELQCRDAGFDCDAVVQGQTVDDVLAQAGPHAKEAHGVDVTPEMAQQIATLVRDR